MKEVFVMAGLIFACGIAAIGIGAVAKGGDFFLFQFFAPKFEEVKREVFERSKEYQHGIMQELDKMRLEYVRESNESVKSAIRSRALRLIAEFDRENLPADIRGWVNQLESEDQ